MKAIKETFNATQWKLFEKLVPISPTNSRSPSPLDKKTQKPSPIESKQPEQDIMTLSTASDIPFSSKLPSTDLHSIQSISDIHSIQDLNRYQMQNHNRHSAKKSKTRSKKRKLSRHKMNISNITRIPNNCKSLGYTKMEFEINGDEKWIQDSLNTMANDYQNHIDEIHYAVKHM